jgi:class 3 adenylate cyclase
MLPETIQPYGIGPFFGLASNTVMAGLCLVTFVLYRHYRPLGILFLFYLFLTFFFLGFIIYRLQRSPESILLGYRINLAALALLPTSWVWFASAILDERPGRFCWVVTGISLLFALFAFLGGGPWLLGLPLEHHPTDIDVLRPQSKLLLPLVSLFGLVICLYYFWVVSVRLYRFKGKRPVYLLPFGIGLLLWFLGGIHDALQSLGMVMLMKDKILWFASFWLSIFLTIAIALHYRSLEQAVRETRDVFERFVPPAYLRRIATDGLQSIRLGEADQQEVTVLCCDIHGFTFLSEKISPSQLVSFINQVLERINNVVAFHQGVIDKFLGDAVLCIFEGTDSAQRAVACGVEMLAKVKSFNAEKKRETQQEVKVGIGLHIGPVILGTIGSSERMDSTVLGFAVNLAKRLEELTRPLNVDMLISKEVASRLPSDHRYRFRELGEVLVRGSSAPVSIIEVYEEDEPKVRELKDRVRPMMSEGMELFKNGRLEAALSKFQEAQSLFPQDLPLQFLTSSLKRTMEQGQTISGTVLLDLSQAFQEV